MYISFTLHPKTPSRQQRREVNVFREGSSFGKANLEALYIYMYKNIHIEHTIQYAILKTVERIHDIFIIQLKRHAVIKRVYTISKLRSFRVTEENLVFETVQSGPYSSFKCFLCS